MFALVESGSITKMMTGSKGITIGDLQYPASIFTLWSESDRNAIGIYIVEEDNTNRKDPHWYVNTELTYTFGSGKVTAAYGTATAKPMADTKWTQSEIDAGEAPTGADTNTVKSEGLKTIKKREIDSQCANLLEPSDYMAIKAAEGISMDSGWKTWRASVRTKCNSMQTQIDNAADIDALAALYVYNESNERPLGEFPVKE
ncbi:N-acetylmuramidase/lysin [uncultured Mediterranean phage]|nr:N-acetylmuramidase/lysin [uncultured Mediterranean phage]